MKNKTIILCLINVASILIACKKNDPKNPVSTIAQEQITTIILNGYNHNNPNDTKHKFMVKWEDLDGDGGKAPSIDSLVLDTGFEYLVNLLVIDKTKTPFDTISKTLETLKNIHQFFYTPSASLQHKLYASIKEFDTNKPPLPFGMEVHLNVMSDELYSLPVLGSLNIVLSHYDGIPKTATKSPESDIDITIPLRLK